MFTKYNCHLSKAVLLFFFFSFIFSLEAQEDIAQKSIREFADFLYSSELYELAAEEYERVLFYDDNDVEVLKRLIRCYTFTGNDNLLDQRMDLFQTTDKTVALSYYDLLLSIGEVEKLAKLYQAQQSMFSEQEQAEVAFKLATERHDWHQVQKIFDGGKVENYAPIYDRITRTKWKKPGAAALMSALIPGAGRIYAKDAKDGIISFIFVGSFAYQSYRRFDKSGIDSVGGWIYGGLALGFYVSNIYGSYQSAKYYNKKENEKIVEFSRPLLLPAHN